MEVSLQWTDIDIDMDLRVNFTGFHDVQDICEGFEHFYSPSSNDGYIPEGLYPVYVTYAADKDINASLREYQDIIVRIKVPGHDETRVVSLKVLDSLNNGHIADIKVEKQKVKVVLKDDFQRSSTVIYYGSNGGWALSGGSSGGSGGGYYGGGGSSGGWGYTYTPAPIDQGYIYSIIWHLREVVFGPLAGADISIYAINDYNMTSGIGVNPIHTDKTSYGSSVNTAGIITIPNEIFEALDDEKLYVVEAKGGMDIDVNDDRVTDAVPTINVGKARVVMSGSALKNIGFKINILTEMAYQISKKYYNENDLSKFIDKSDEAVKCLLKKDINLDEQINTADALYFTPYSDMDGLYGSFRNEFMPIITDIYSGKDI
ncbi:MAG: hypothetical protein LBP40_05495, partial [Campylobacteraceae bacterium]|nr:hypothetical protein [Campylobacteraceae bacterium]